MFRIGCHLSIADGYFAAAEAAAGIGANTFQYFSRNPRGGAARAVDVGDIERFKTYCGTNGIAAVLAHAPYTINAASADPRIAQFARTCIEEDLRTMRNFEGFMYNVHPGSHTGAGAEAGIERIVQILDAAVRPDQNTTVLLEAMSGKGSEIGGDFTELYGIISRCGRCGDIGVCIDTCHIYSAGYDIVGDLDGVLEKFDKTVGLTKLKAVHLNDSMTPFNSRKDRHELLGKGSIGLDAFAKIINHPRLKDLPFYLETPNDLPGYAAEIALLKSLRN
ncbi:MAG: deoxyribonuclease IV [Clostridiales bacterium]|jgi:deoxyribonuclease-4|nr:deoxyribonuclease IV [Clostridiales bacterium]